MPFLLAERLEELNGLKEKLQNAIEDHAKALENLKSEHKHEVDSIKEDFTKEHEDRIERGNVFLPSW